MAAGDGLAGADNLCRQLADAVGELTGKSWIAYLGIPDEKSPHERLPEASGPWHRRGDDALVFDSRNAVRLNNLANELDRDETGAQVAAGTAVWTGVNNTTTGNYHCSSWTDPFAANGSYGSVASTTSTWDDAGRHGCGSTHRLYCFEE